MVRELKEHAFGSLEDEVAFLNFLFLGRRIDDLLRVVQLKIGHVQCSGRIFFCIQ